MKKLIFICIMAVVYTGFNSCSKDSSSDIVVYKVPAPIVARFIGLAFSNATFGVNSQLENAAMFTATGYSTFDSAFLIKKTDTTQAATYSYDMTYNFDRQTTPVSKTTFGYTASGHFTSASMISVDDPKGNWEITTLDQALLTLNGTGQDKGSQFAVTEEVPFNTTVSYTFQNVMMDKVSPFMAASGIVLVTVNGTGPLEVIFSYSGTLTFKGNRQADLVLAGTTFHLNLLTGAVSN
jgi:hypothetical protein